MEINTINNFVKLAKEYKISLQGNWKETSLHEAKFVSDSYPSNAADWLDPLRRSNPVLWDFFSNLPQRAWDEIEEEFCNTDGDDRVYEYPGWRLRIVLDFIGIPQHFERQGFLTLGYIVDSDVSVTQIARATLTARDRGYTELLFVRDKDDDKMLYAFCKTKENA